jgi:acetyl esterase/lipase
VPGLIFIHGGGWKSGSKRDYKYYTLRFADRGYVAASIGYRFSQEAPFPAAVHDTKCAVRWMRENAAELGVDPDRIAVLGGSAGGYLAMMAGYSSDVSELEGEGGHEVTSSAVKVVVNLYGPSDLTVPRAYNEEVVQEFMGKLYAEDPDLYASASPLHHLDKNDPPTFIFQGTIDQIVPVSQADALAEKLIKLQVPYWYDRLDGWPHTMDVARVVNERVMTLLDSFFDRFLKDEPESNP